MLATLLTLATEAPEEETSKTAFYVVGCVAAAWAILLFAVGMRSSTFPSSARTMRGVIAISAVLVIGAMTSSILTA